MPDWTLNTKALNGAATGGGTPAGAGGGGVGGYAARRPVCEAGAGRRVGRAVDPVGVGPGGGGRREVDEDVEQRADAEVGDGGGEEHGGGGAGGGQAVARAPPRRRPALGAPARGRRQQVDLLDRLRPRVGFARGGRGGGEDLLRSDRG